MINKILNKFRETHTDSLIKLIKEIEPEYYVEVGVWKGENVFKINKKFPKLHIIGIDPYIKYNNYLKGGEIAKKEDNKMEELFFKVVNKAFNKDVAIIRKKSKEASKKISNNSLDIVFIDALHTYKDVKKDIKSWLPKIKKGGIICGHDYRLESFGVILAVNEAFGVDNIQIMPGSVWVYRK